jgi:hypothetical protein
MPDVIAGSERFAALFHRAVMTVPSGHFCSHLLLGTCAPTRSALTCFGVGVIPTTVAGSHRV